MTRDTTHPLADQLQSFAEGRVHPGDRAGLAAHILDCAPCQLQVDEWRSLFAALEQLPRFEPQAGFAARVLAHVYIAAPARAHARPAAWLHSVTPRTTFAWAMTAAFLALPLLLGGSLVLWLMDRSSLSPAALWVFVWDRGYALIHGGISTVLTALVQSDIITMLASYATAFLANAGVTGVSALLGASALTTTMSIWVLYRNLFRTPAQETRYVSYSF